jgi:hypothetical protein
MVITTNMVNTMRLKIAPLSASSTSASVTYDLIIRTQSTNANAFARANVCLVNDKQETCFLQSVSPFPVPFTKHMPTRVTFLGPSIGDITHLMIAPEDRAIWRVDSAILRIGEDPSVAPVTFVPSADDPLHVFVPAPPRPTEEQRAQWNMEYCKLKNDLMDGAFLTAATGTIVTDVALGMDKALAYAMGGSLGLMYSAMLHYEMDHIGANNHNHNNKVNGVTRFATLALTAGAIVRFWSAQIQEDNLYYVLGVLGFLSYKMSIMRRFF